jgi:hypothetical protein
MEAKIDFMQRFISRARRFVLLACLVCWQGPGSWAQQTAEASQPAAATVGAKPLIDGNQLMPKPDVHEDWTKLALAEGANELHDGNPFLLETFDYPDYIGELLRAEWRSRDPIDLYVIRPKGAKKPPVILYLYSYPSETDRYRNPQFCKFLTRNGFAAVGFVSALTGHRFHDRPQKEWFISELQESLGSSVHDVQLALNYLQKRGDVDMSRIGIFGDGSGASIAIMAAAVDPRIKVLDLLNPWGDWPDWLAKSTLVPEDERAGLLKPDFLGKVENLDPLKWLPSLNTQRVRLQYIKDGVTVTPTSVKERMAGAVTTGTQVVQYQNTKEFLIKVASAGTGFDWLKHQLGSMIPFAGVSAQNVAKSKSSAARNSDQ